MPSFVWLPFEGCGPKRALCWAAISFMALTHQWKALVLLDAVCCCMYVAAAQGDLQFHVALCMDALSVASDFAASASFLAKASQLGACAFLFAAAPAHPSFRASVKAATIVDSLTLLLVSWQYLQACLSSTTLHHGIDELHAGWTASWMLSDSWAESAPTCMSEKGELAQHAA